LSVAAENPRSAFVDRGIDFDAAYEEHVPLITGVAIERFHIAEIDAKTLAHEVFLAYFFKANDVRDIRAWFLGAICNASRHYLRTRARQVPLPADMANQPDPRFNRVSEALPDQLAAREAFACLTARCQLALGMRYLEGYTIPEIAQQLHTTAKYAQKLVSRCLRQAHDRYAAKGEL
jgi:RNA polymerase sigma factor (sigma-70 family)